MAVDRQIKRNPNPQERKQMVVQNAEDIKTNHKLIKQNRTIIATLGVFLAISIITVIYLLANQHDMEACQAKLFTHITGMDAPTKAQLMKGENPPIHFKKIESPKVYRELFEGCQ